MIYFELTLDIHQLSFVTPQLPLRHSSYVGNLEKGTTDARKRTPSTIIAIIGAVTGILGFITATIAIVQTRKANKLSQDANTLAEKANGIAKKSIAIASKANGLATEANKISSDANTISKRALSVTADQTVYDWGFKFDQADFDHQHDQQQPQHGTRRDRDRPERR